MGRLELPRVTPLEPKSSASTSFATFALTVPSVGMNQKTPSLVMTSVGDEPRPNLPIIGTSHPFFTLSLPTQSMSAPPNEIAQPKDAPHEGVIKFILDHQPSAPITHPALVHLNAWRSLLFRLKLTGQDPTRYGGLGYGNLSIRSDGDAFIISGTQTGGIDLLTDTHFTHVLHADLDRHYLESQGPLPPSSEAMTHAAAYQANNKIQCVMHIHEPSMWRNARELGLNETAPDIAYGTPEMAASIAAIARKDPCCMIAMGGHEDGLIALGTSIQEAGMILTAAWIRNATLANQIA